MTRLKYVVLAAVVAGLVFTQLPFLAELPHTPERPFAVRPFTPDNLTSIFDTLLATRVAYAQTPPASTTYALPQLAFGENWYTALYFSNTTDSATTVQVKFYGPDGTPLNVPIIGSGPVSTMNVTVNPRATAILEAPGGGALQQGWTEAALPSGVVGYGVFRQSVPGREAQEAVVPLSPMTRQMADLTWDDAGFTTAVAIVNPSLTPNTVTMTVFRDDGSTIGSSTVNLAAQSRVAFVLREQPGMAGMTSRRGFARFSASSGAVAALGLRFASSAFTSIPVSYP